MLPEAYNALLVKRRWRQKLVGSITTHLKVCVLGFCIAIQKSHTSFIDDILELDFSKVTAYKPDFDILQEEPIPYYLTDLIRDRVYAITMGMQHTLSKNDHLTNGKVAITNLPFDEWFVFDRNYKTRMALKKKAIEEVGSDAIDCREGGYEGCVELLECLVDYLPRRFPTIFSISSDGKEIHNRVTNETYDIMKPYTMHHPLYIAGRLVEDDLNILVEGPNGEYVLKAVLSAFPAGFQVKEKMDKGMAEIHKPVPMYKERLQKAMDRSVVFLTLR